MYSAGGWFIQPPFLFLKQQLDSAYLKFEAEICIANSHAPEVRLRLAAGQIAEVLCVLTLDYLGDRVRTLLNELSTVGGCGHLTVRVV